MALNKRKRNLYDPKSDKPFKLSRSKIELFLQCPRCFFLDRKLGIGRPSGPPFTLNMAVDHLLKQEFDVHRAKGTQHPLQKQYGIDAIPVPHECLKDWLNNFKGVQYYDPSTNFLIFGAIDDLWKDSRGNYIVVDYKATAVYEPITELNKPWHGGYKRQMEIYQWLLRKNGLSVSDTGYFVYCNGKKDRKAFNRKLEFEISLIPYTGSADWIEGVLKKIYHCLSLTSPPADQSVCEFCYYRKAEI